MMTYSLYEAFNAYITFIEHFRNLDSYRDGAKIIRAGLPPIDKSKQGWRDILEVKNFVEFVLTEEDTIVSMVAQEDGASTIEALTEDAKSIMMNNSEDIRRVIFMQT